MNEELKFLKLLKELFETENDEFGREFFCHDIVKEAPCHKDGITRMIRKAKEIIEERIREVKGL